MMCNNPKLDIDKMNTYIKFGEIISIGSQDIERKQFFCVNKGHNSDTNMQKMMCNNHKQHVDLANMNADIKFGEKMSDSSENIERKRNFGVMQGP